MPDAELRDLGTLAGEVADETVISMVQGMHEGISGRVFRAIGPGAEPGLMHFHLLNHPLVYECIREWLESAPAEAGAPVSLSA